VTTDEERVDHGGWMAMTLRRYWGLENCGSLYVPGSGNDFVSNAFLNFKPVQRFHNLIRIEGPGNCSNYTSKRILDMLKAT